MRIAVSALLCILSILLAAPVCADEVMDVSKRRILLLYSYHPTFPTASKVLEGLLSEFKDGSPVVEIEYMDSKRVYNETSVELFRQNLEYKLSKREPYDVVVTADDNALHFMLKEGDTLFPETPIVFLGLNNIALAQRLSSNFKVTGVIEAVSIKETIELAEQLFPHMKTLHIISDGTTSGSSDLTSTMDLQSKFPALPFSVINLASLSWDSFAEKLASLPEDDTILLLSAYRDKTLEGLSFEKSFSLIMEFSQIPVFHPFEHGMGDGAFGGVLISHREQARQAALKVKQIFAGTNVGDIPILDKSPNIAVLDQRQLDRFGISTSSLPSQAEVRFHTPSALTRYWKELTVVAVIILLMLVIIIILALKIRVRQSFRNLGRG